MFVARPVINREMVRADVPKNVLVVKVFLTMKPTEENRIHSYYPQTHKQVPKYFGHHSAVHHKVLGV